MSDTTTTAAVLSDELVASYHEDGYLLLDSFVDREWLDRLRAAAARWVDESRSLTRSDKRLDLEEGHSAQQPRLRRLTAPVDHDETFREFALAGPPAEIAAAILGRPARFHHSKLNYKWSDGGAEIDWHQDIQYWPHSDFTPLTIGVYLEDVDAEMGPMGVLPGSHRGQVYDLFDEADRWTGSLRAEDMAALPLDDIHFLAGPAGSVTVHNCVAVHGSVPNTSPRPRPLLLQTYSAATSYPLLGVGTNGRTGDWSGTLVGGGSPPRWIEVEGRRMPAAPDWSRGGYTTIFDAQQRTSTT